MSTEKTKSPGKLKGDARHKRLEEALRQNLQRRKQQARGRRKKASE
ncbi:MAG: hypothetical protein IH901_04975 [Proteobacteria bacterium]|nr:hypothetical protein [Pseudomonadota bacterium]